MSRATGSFTRSQLIGFLLHWIDGQHQPPSVAPAQRKPIEVRIVAAYKAQVFFSVTTSRDGFGPFLLHFSRIWIKRSWIEQYRSVDHHGTPDPNRGTCTSGHLTIFYKTHVSKASKSTTNQS